ncbi:MAG: M48 family metallopeptidase [Gammaproteobacteria bacterium]|nr:M48 family metallopeptidase [Gammaproteobacteria bacterium]
MSVSRREFLVGGVCGCALGAVPHRASAAPAVAALQPLVVPGYRPVDPDERGLWQSCEQFEEQLAASNLLVRDAGLNGYVGEVLRRLLGELHANVRHYVVRDPDFNASMFPNGMTLVHTGLLARMRNEGQLAAVLGHESGHYLRRHSLQNWRSIRRKSALMASIALGGAAATGATGGSWYELADVINTALVLSVFAYSREHESEADAYGLQLLAAAGYPPQSAAQIWEQVIAERRASAAVRGKKYRDAARSALSTHPPADARRAELLAAAAALEKDTRVQYDERRGAWQAAIGAWRPMLLEEQIKLNDTGASLYLLEALAQDGWDSLLRFNEGETYRLRDASGDAERAAAAYAAAVQFTEVVPEAYRAHGYALLRSGRVTEGHQALERYLAARPDAVDAAMVRFTLAQPGG